MIDMKNVQHQLDQFPDLFKSVVISTFADAGEPYLSYVPFVRHQDAYYLIMSKIAKHYANLKKDSRLSFILIEDEKEAQNIFFRKRLSYVANGSFDVDASVKDAFSHKFGEFVNRLFLMDFVLVKCEISKGSFIIGPGQAYEIDDKQKIVIQMTGNENQGHQKS